MGFGMWIKDRREFGMDFRVLLCLTVLRQPGLEEVMGSLFGDVEHPWHMHEEVARRPLDVFGFGTQRGSLG